MAVHLNERVVYFDNICSDYQLSPSRHRVPRVCGEVHQYLNNLVAVGYNDETVAIGFYGKLDIFTDQL
jgi:hypothetical protein